MGRNLYILAGTLAVFSLLSCGVVFTSVAASPGDRSLWHVMGLVLLLAALIVMLAGVLTGLFEQVERKAEERRRNHRN